MKHRELTVKEVRKRKLVDRLLRKGWSLRLTTKAEGARFNRR
jgi:hypothetical protein